MIIFKIKGVPLDGAALLRSAVKLQTNSPFTISKSTSKYDDVDGTPSKLNQFIFIIV